MLNERAKISRKISYILRHNPTAFGLTADGFGYIKTSELINEIKKEYVCFDFNYLKEIVYTDEKCRYSFNDDFTIIKANYGHSFYCDLNLIAVRPPDVLYHGTSERFLESILKNGLTKQNREYVHLSTSKEIAIKVGSRHGKAIILEINAKKMFEDGFVFYNPTKDIYLTNNIKNNYFKIII